MTTLFLNEYNVHSDDLTTPKWMREERYGYCEPTSQKPHTFKFLWSKLVTLFL